MNEGTDFLATELLKELKAANERKDERIVRMTQNYTRTVYGFLVVIFGIVAAFLLYLNQYDFSSTITTTMEAQGVYALIDSEGNVIAQDFTPDELERILEVLNNNGNGKEDSSQDSLED